MLAVAAVLASLLATSTGGSREAADYRTGAETWRSAERGFAGWRLAGGAAVDARGVLRLAAGAPAGEALSPVVRTGFEAREAVPSWNAATPAGTWVEARLRARVAGRWTRWYELGVWSSRDGARRHSVAGQRDARGRVATDTLVLAAGADALQLALRLRSERGGASPSLRLAAVAFSAAPKRPRMLAAGDRSLWGRLLDVPRYSQMVYPDGGEVWCSPTSVAMVVAYWQRDRGAPEPRVRRAVRGVYDGVYRGHGNWSFNVAFAATQGLDARVARLASLRDVERWVAAGVPVVLSYAWRPGQLAGSSGSSDGHLGVVVGFDRSGNPVVNDPAARSDAAVRRTYRRAQLERLWLEHSGGTVYLIHPPRHRVPPLP